MIKDAFETVYDALLPDSIETAKLAREIKHAAFRGDDEFLLEIASMAARHLDDWLEAEWLREQGEEK